jgi:hypothetical protein
VRPMATAIGWPNSAENRSFKRSSAISMSAAAANAERHASLAEAVGAIVVEAIVVEVMAAWAEPGWAEAPLAGSSWPNTAMIPLPVVRMIAPLFLTMAA